MVSRRKILSRSRDDLHTDTNFHPPEEEEDIWYQKEKLCKDHIQEVLDKWTQIDDEIWAKVIVLEKNRRVAKAYARTPVLTVNGSDDGFDGFRIGLCGFENPMRDQETDDLRKHIGHGVKIKMDDAGNILIKRISKCNVFVKNMGQDEENAIGNEILRLPGGALEPEKPFKLFDMKKFQSNVNRELRRAYPYRRRLECQCLSAIAFVKSQPEPLDCPIWVLIINVVAMDMLKSKLPPAQRIVDIKNRPRIPVPDEDPYSVAGNGNESLNGFGFAATKEHLLQSQAQRRSDKPPKLPPRENFYPHNIPMPDYDDGEAASSKLSTNNKDKSNKSKKYDDPYYCGMRARVPNFVSKTKGKESISSKRLSIVHPQPLITMPLPAQHQYHLREHHQQQSMWPSYNHKVFNQYADRKEMVLRRIMVPNPGKQKHPQELSDNLSVGHASDSPYNKVNGQMPISTRNYVPSQNRTMFIGEWD